MSQYKSQIQNMFLSMVRKKHQPVEVVLNTGTTLRGKVKGYDQFSITLNFKDKSEVIYKSAILYITALPKRKRSSAARGAGPGAGARRLPGTAGVGPGGPPPRPRRTPPGDEPPMPVRPPKPPPRMYIDDERDPPPPRKKIRIDDEPPPPRKPPKPI